MSIRKLAGQTAIYGISSIIGRALYFLLTPIYTNIFPTEEYGVVTGLFALMGFGLVVFTYRMEMAYFRFGADEPKNSFDTGFSSLVMSTVVLALLFLLFSGETAQLLGYPDHADLVAMCAGIIALDALSEIPFARLRLEGRPIRFAAIRLTGIGLNLGLNLFFLILCPWILQQEGLSSLHAIVNAIYDPEYGIGYIFFSNLMASALTLGLLLLFLRGFQFGIDRGHWKEMMRYALPLVLVGFSFVINEMLDRQLLPLLGSGTLEENQSQLGIYGANYKLAMILSLFTQAFRYGAEPFFFKERHKSDARQNYALVAKYFALIGLFGFLGIMLFLDIFKYFIGEDYWGGLHVVPVLLLANLMLGLYYNLTVWYKLTDKTMWGAYISLGGALITIGLNIWWIPVYSYTGSAWATLICYGSMAVVCYLLGQRHYAIPYPVGRFLLYLAASIGLWGLAEWWQFDQFVLEMGKNALLFLTFTSLVVVLEFKEIRKIVS
jgi:O-antigen/teichoic acid export membrane protein